MPLPVRARSWAVLVLLVLACSGALALVGLPSPVLFGALVAGLTYALGTTTAPGARPLAVPPLLFRAGQAVLGAAIGSLFDPDTFAALRSDWLPVLAVCLATLVLSVLAGLALRLHPAVTAATGTFAMVAGGASGIVAIARELGADDRIVAVVQYLRVLVILLGMPLVAQVIFHSSARTAPAGAGGHGGLAVQLAATVACVLAGLLLDRFVDIPAGALLFPLGVAVLISLAGGAVTVPSALQAVGFALIGLQVGLRFTRASLRAVASLLPLALTVIVALIAASALLGVVLAGATGHSALDGYLATTPGGLYAVLATAIGNGSDVTFVLTVQIVRLFAVLFSAPLLARWLRGGRA